MSGKKRVLVLTEQKEWLYFVRRVFPLVAGDIADFHIWDGGFDITDDSFLENHAYKADLIWAAHPYQIFPKRLTRRVTCINSHPGYNPYNRGWYPYAFSLINGLPAGATLHEMDHRIDHGPIIHRTQVRVEEHDTAYTLWQKCRKAEKELITTWLRPVILGEYKTFLPEHDGNYNSKADYEKLFEIDPQSVVNPIDFLRRLRALTWRDRGKAVLQLPGGKLQAGVLLDFIPDEDNP